MSITVTHSPKKLQAILGLILALVSMFAAVHLFYGRNSIHAEALAPSEIAGDVAFITPCELGGITAREAVAALTNLATSDAASTASIVGTSATPNVIDLPNGHTNSADVAEPRAASTARHIEERDADLIDAQAIDDRAPQAGIHFANLAADLSALKEAAIRERYGVVRRGGRWIPTTGGGTNIVYITTGALASPQVGVPYSVRFNAESGCPPYRWAIAAGSLPDALTLDAAGQLAGIPSTPAAATFMLTVTDARGASDMAEYFLVVQPERPLAFLTEYLPPVAPGTNFIFQFQAIGGVPPYTWMSDMEGDIAGDSPLNLSFDTLTGILYGDIAPETPEQEVTICVHLADAQLELTRNFVLYIRSRPTIVETLSQTFQQNEFFTYSFQATGGLPPYNWSYTGELPPEITLSHDGTLSGLPRVDGSYELDIIVQDAENQYDAAPYTLQITPDYPKTILNFEAFISLNRIGLQWTMPSPDDTVSIRLVRTSHSQPAVPADGITIYQGHNSSYVDETAGHGTHYYAAFLEVAGTVVTSTPPPILKIQFPSTVMPFADNVVSANLLHPNAFRATELPHIVLGPPRGTGMAWGSADVVSLGAAVNDDHGATAPYGGSIILEFKNHVAWNGPGADFTVFENVFYICDAKGIPDPNTRFMEPAIVAVSQDGVTWRQFKTDFSPRYHPDTGRLNLRHPYCYNRGFAGVNPVMSNGLEPDPTDPAVSGGDSFDLSDVEWDWIRFVRIQSTGSAWLVDGDGDLIYHIEDTQAASRNFSQAGFDLDAVTAIWVEKIVNPLN